MAASFTHLGVYSPSKWCVSLPLLQPHKSCYPSSSHSISIPYQILKHVLFICFCFQSVDCCYFLFLIGSYALFDDFIRFIVFEFCFYSVHVHCLVFLIPLIHLPFIIIYICVFCLDL